MTSISARQPRVSILWPYDDICVAYIEEAPCRHAANRHVESPHLAQRRLVAAWQQKRAVAVAIEIVQMSAPSAKAVAAMAIWQPARTN